MQAFLRFTLAAVSGWLVYISYEPHGLWWAAIAGIALLYAALAPWPAAVVRGLGTPGDRTGPSAWLGALLGFTQVLFCYLYLLPWIGYFVGAMPYVALSIFLALYGIATGVFGVWCARWRFGFAAFPLIYLTVEVARSSFPFGGFSWVRLAWGQVSGPLAPLAAWGGPTLVTLAAAAAGAGFAALFASRRTTVRAAAVTSIALPLMLGPVAGLTSVDDPSRASGSIRAAAVQGNVPRLGLDFNAQRRAVLTNHVNETLRLAEDARRSGERLDLVIWPENASDVNPFEDAEAEALIGIAVRAVDAPVLVGTLTRDEVGARNTMQVFDPVSGAGEYHHKRYLQPFGEYMPMRDFFRNFSDMVDLASDFKPGNGSGVVRMGDTTVGIATCYEVGEDPAYRMAVRNGAQILATPTNNATFGFTDMTYQQLAMSRMRAIETDRAVVVAATSGVSAIVHPDGSVSQHTGIFEAAHLVENLPVKTGLTPAVRYGDALQIALVIAGGVLMAFAAVSARASRRGYAAARRDAVIDHG